MEKDIEIDGLTIHYEESGNPVGAPVILMHGWGCNHSTVRSIAQSLEPELHIFNLDLPGHGKSDEPAEAWGPEEFADNIEKFIKLKKLKDPILIGHSHGGRVSILVASRNKTGKVVLVDAAGIVNPKPLKTLIKQRTFKLIKRTAPLFGKKIGSRLIDKAQSFFGSADYKNSSSIMRATMSKCVNEDLRHVMPSIKASTLLIWGDDDTATPLSDAYKMEKLIPEAGLVHWPGCGHYSFLDNRGAFTAVMRSFFKDEIMKGALQ